MTEISRYAAESALEAAEAYADFDDRRPRLYPGYSGRFMYGEKCLGLVYSTDRQVEAFYEGLREALATEVEPEEAEEIVEAMREAPSHDQMGLQGIVYWRGFQCPELEGVDAA